MKTILIMIALGLNLQASAKTMPILSEVEGSLQVVSKTNAKLIADRADDVSVAYYSVSQGIITIQLLATAECGYYGKMGGFCPEVMEMVKEIKLPIQSVTKSACGDTYTASTPLNELREAAETITLVDMSQAVCDLVMQGVGNITYENRSMRGQAEMYFIMNDMNPRSTVGW